MLAAGCQGLSPGDELDLLDSKIKESEPAPKRVTRGKSADGPKGKTFDKPRKPKGDGGKPRGDKPAAAPAPRASAAGNPARATPALAR